LHGSGARRLVFQIVLGLEAIQKEVAHDFDTDGNAPFVRIKIWAVQRSDTFFIWGFYAQEEEEAGNFLAV